MLTFDQIKEIRMKLAYMKVSLLQSLHDLIYIEEIDLIDPESLSYEQANEIRKRVARMKLSVVEKLNLLLRCWEQLKKYS